MPPDGDRPPSPAPVTHFLSAITRIMNLPTIAILLIFTTFCASCASNEQLQQRVDKRNDAYSNYNERREIRTDARQERTDMWFDRHMH
jgi:hypothetical protein